MSVVTMECAIPESWFLGRSSARYSLSGVPLPLLRVMLLSAIVLITMYVYSYDSQISVPIIGRVLNQYIMGVQVSREDQSPDLVEYRDE